LGLGCGGGSLRLGRLLWLLVGLGIVRRTSTALEVFETALKLLAVVALSNAILYPSALGKVRDLGPVLIRVGRSTESTACS
jgi:hypothetical protein